jgi:hypothetical protein
MEVEAEDQAEVTYTVMVTITDPNGAEVFTMSYPGAPVIEFSFSDTPTLGTYTVTADCDMTIEVDECAASACAGTSEIVGSYTPGEFTVVAAEAAAADAAPADVVAATPTFTG